MTNNDPDKYFNSWYDIGLNSCSLYLILNFDWGHSHMLIIENQKQ